MKRSIIVVDNFYDDPQKVRDIAINSQYPTPTDNYTYPGKNSKTNFYTKEIHNKFEEILGRKLVASNPNGFFRLSLEKDKFKQDIHVDPVWQFGAVCYLNTPEQCIDEGGTSFWIHNSSGQDQLLDSDEKARMYGYTSKNSHWEKVVYGDGLDRKLWSRYFLCPMKYNRVVIFRSNLWHSHNYNFGKDISDGRLVQLFFFNPINFFDK